jgi:large subunit ribosomal protein L13
MKTIFPKKELHVPKWFILDATGKTLGRLSTEISKLLRGKEISYYTPGVDLGNYVIVINANKIEVSGNKDVDKLYYTNSKLCDK